MYLAITKVKPLDNYKLLLKFKNNEEKIFNMSDYLNIGEFAELKNISSFNTVRVKFDSIAWENNLDIDSELLYKASIPK